MANSERAIDLYHRVAETVINFRTSPFYLEHDNLSELDAGFEATARFLLERPAMLIGDAQSKDKALQFIEKEWYEAEHAEEKGDADELFAELGDMTFFALLAGTLHWQELSGDEKDFVQRSIVWSGEKALENKMSAVEAVVYVADVKDPINYRSEFYQLREEDETPEQVHERVAQIGKLHRKIREELNGSLKGSDNLLKTLAERWYIGNLETDIEARQIEALFELAGIDLLAHLEV